jgi:hypothetical protein
MASVVPLRKSRRVIDGIGNLVGTHCHRFSVEHVCNVDARGKPGRACACGKGRKLIDRNLFYRLRAAIEAFPFAALKGSQPEQSDSLTARFPIRPHRAKPQAVMIEPHSADQHPEI